MVRLPDSKGSHMFHDPLMKESPLDARLEGIDFHIKTPENRQAFRAFLEFMQRESQQS